MKMELNEDDKNLICDKDQIEALSKELFKVMDALREWRHCVVYFGVDGMRLTRLCISHCVQLLLDATLIVLKDIAELGLRVPLNEDFIKALKELDEEKRND